MTDERLGHAQREEVLLTKRPKTVDSRVSLEERIAMFRDEMYSNVLPSLPKIDGFHVCWVSTTHQSDTPARRERLGYEAVKPEELPGFQGVTVQSGPFAGCVQLNEMIAMKLPLPLYYAYMQVAHAERPMDHQRKMGNQLAGVQRNGDGVKVELADGSQSFMRASSEPRPQFED